MTALRFGHDLDEEGVRHEVLWEALPVLREGRRVEAAATQVEVEELRDEQVHWRRSQNWCLLRTEKGRSAACLEQALGLDGKTAARSVHLVKQR